MSDEPFRFSETESAYLKRYNYTDSVSENVLSTHEPLVMCTDEFIKPHVEPAILLSSTTFYYFLLS
jgi:hypothetical protein